MPSKMQAITDGLFNRQLPGVKVDRRVRKLYMKQLRDANENQHNEEPVLLLSGTIASPMDTFDAAPVMEQPEMGKQQAYTEPLVKEDMLIFVKKHSLRWYQPLLFMFSLISYISDVVSDGYLVYAYHQREDLSWAYLTLALMLVPALVITSFSITWYVLDAKNKVDPPRSWYLWTFRVAFHIFQLAPVVRTFDAIIYGMKARNLKLSTAKRYRYVQLMMYEDHDAAMLRLLEAFMEAAPQLLLQLYIQFTQPLPSITTTLIAQWVSIMLSWLSLAWCLASYQTISRASQDDKANMTWRGTLFYVFWKAGVLSSRILSLALFVAAFRSLYFGSFLVAHWALFALLLVVGGTNFCSKNPNTVPEFVFDFVMGAIYIFDVINVREGHSRLWYGFCYTVLFVENAVLSFLWYLRPVMTVVYTGLGQEIDSDAAKQGDVKEPPGILRYISREATVAYVWCSFFFGLTFMLVYYRFAHPSGKIETCLPCSELCKNFILTTPTPSDSGVSTPSLDLNSAAPSSWADLTLVQIAGHKVNLAGQTIKTIDDTSSKTTDILSSNLDSYDTYN